MHVTTYESVGLMAGGVLAERTGRAARAQQLWRRGRALALEGLSEDMDSVVLKIQAAAFLGYARDPAFPVEAARIVHDVKAARLNPWPLVHLATAYAYAGDNATAVDILRYQLDRGRLIGRGWMTFWTPGLKTAPGFKELLGDYEREEGRRHRLYGAS
jgi:hypothetical protein